MAELYDQGDDCPPVCGDCLYGCPRAPHKAACDVPGCGCPCTLRVNPDAGVRARELDDRPPNKLHVIANEIERETKPSVEELMAERYGRKPRRAA